MGIKKAESLSAKLKSEGLHERHAASSLIMGMIRACEWRQCTCSKTSQDGRSQDQRVLPS